ncbi:Putative multidrug export ATP-binding/permease protein [Pseudoalteromonas holothuriae]|uniref:Multidrug export ATP-binding/permease protein n=1 Tax=Pseudoalteromonas holothuriae TaxID=2963714 RepID=A0A9W4QUJ5_9GAMM|nr:MULTISPECIES: ABC transporter transmembrane domain-containing protein [unclassified Pseudoalteromonas]CAH9053901.1 Putative multidrug export ATP-binding/permease protein [Pseudoalteromonas sp. CIP111854]CAH9064406.1 Putative multidrug export ATP-binding/permease protein [Pseudoalteromonas sp. CIP111951]
MSNLTAAKNVANTKEPIKSILPIISFVKPYKLMVLLALLALFVTSAVTLSLGQGVRFVVDSGFVANSSAQLQSAVLSMIVLILLLAIGTFFRFYLMSWLGERVVADLRKAVFEKIVFLHPSYFEDNRSGEITSRLTTDTGLLQSIIGVSFSMALRGTLMLIGGVIMLFITNFKLAIIVIAFVPLVLLPILVFGKKVRKLASSSQDAIADIGTYAGEIIQNIKVVQSYTQEKSEYQAFSNEVESAFIISKARIRHFSLLIATAIFFIFSAITAMFWVGGNDVILAKITAGELAAFAFYAVLVAMSVATIAEVYSELQRAAGAAQRLLHLLEVDSNLPNALQPEKLALNADMTIDIKQLSFSYPSRPTQIALDQIDLTINHGEVVAIVGPSGAGKSTLFEMLQRFYDPQQGMISINGVNVRDISLSDLRALMGLVPQNPILFSADVMHNIRYGKPSASDEEVIRAAKKAHAHEFIEALPQGYSSYLGEQGVRLSGGQKQRIAIARAILKDPKILLLDEATSALDSQSEYHVQAALVELMKQRTTLIIAHRLSTVKHADSIVVMDKGKIVNRGKHHVLIDSDPLYKRLCQLQFESSHE